MIAAEPLASPRPTMMRMPSQPAGKAEAHGRRIPTWLAVPMVCLVLLLTGWLLMLALSERAPRYETRLPVPSGRETYAEVTPVTIAGIERDFEALPGRFGDIQGTRIRYGDVARIDIVHLPSMATLDRFVVDEVQPRLLRYERRDSEHGPGGWRIEGGADIGARLYAWQNQDWLFVIEAESQSAFDEIVDQFIYIRRQ